MGFGLTHRGTMAADVFTTRFQKQPVDIRRPPRRPLRDPLELQLQSAGPNTEVSVNGGPFGAYDPTDVQFGDSIRLRQGGPGAPVFGTQFRLGDQDTCKLDLRTVLPEGADVTIRNHTTGASVSAVAGAGGRIESEILVDTTAQNTLQLTGMVDGRQVDLGVISFLAGDAVKNDARASHALRRFGQDTTRPGKPTKDKRATLNPPKRLQVNAANGQMHVSVHGLRPGQHAELVNPATDKAIVIDGPVTTAQLAELGLASGDMVGVRVVDAERRSPIQLRDGARRPLVIPPFLL